MLKVRAIRVPADCDYITEGNIYEAEFEDKCLFKITDDEDEIIWCLLFGGCGHGISWEIAK